MEGVRLVGLYIYYTSFNINFSIQYLIENPPNIPEIINQQWTEIINTYWTEPVDIL